MFSDKDLQNKINQKLVDAISGIHPECVTSSAFNTPQVQTETLTEEKLIAVLNKIETEIKVNKEDTIKWLHYLGLNVMVNDFMSDERPLVILPASYKEAMEKIKAEHPTQEGEDDIS